MRKMHTKGIFLPLMLILGFIPVQVFADATTARQEIQDTQVYIQERVDSINDLAREKKLGEALEMLTDLNRYIESNLTPVFYDNVLEVRREEPGYAPPSLSLSLGEAFTEAFWDAKVAQAEKSLKDATEALQGVAAMRTLNKQDEAFSYLKTAYDTFSSLKDIVEDLATVNVIGLAKDFYDGANGFIDNYKAIEEAKLAGLETEAFAQNVKTMARRAEKTLEKMKDLKSAFTVYSDDVLRFEYNLRNIQNYTVRAVNDPAFPLDFSNELYAFDIGPYLTSMDSLKADFEAGEYCWDVFDYLYQKIYQEAGAERQQITANINGSSEPDSNKQIYLKDVNDNWAYFDAYADNLYTPHRNARVDALGQYDTLKATVDAGKAERNALIAAYWDESGFPQQDLRTFQEEEEGIVQLTISDGPGPYFLGREYNPYFPTGPLTSSLQMPAHTPDIIDYSFADYGSGLVKLAYAYRVMAEAGLKTNSTYTYANGSPVATVAVSPLSEELMGDVEFNLYRVRDQALDFEAFMKGKQEFIDAAISKHAEVETAEADLISHVMNNWSYLCLDASIEDNEASRQWDNLIVPVLISDWNIGDDVESAVASVDSHIGYIQGQNAFNGRMKKTKDLLLELQGKATLNSLIRFIVTDYNSLPDFPSEQGYRDFLTELNYLHAFYGPASLDGLMDLREEIIALFKEIYGEGVNQWFSTRNPYCLIEGTEPDAVGYFQQLLSAIGIWSDRHIEAVRQGFPGWDAWAKSQLAEFWPEGNSDDVRPRVTHFTPGRNSEETPLYQIVRVSFSEAIDGDTLAGGAILLEAKGIERSFTVRYDSALNALLINSGRMLPGTIYTVTLTEEITDLAGNPLVPESWSFSTEEVTAGATPVGIVINGVEEGGAYDEPVTITISVSSGGYSASLSYNGEPAEPVVSGLTVSRRGAYDLTVTADSGLSRSVYFTMGTETEAYELNIANEFTAADRSDTVTTSEYVGAGLRYFVDGQRYFYLYGGKVYLFDMRTGENSLLFETGDYYQGTGGYNAEPSTSCSFLGISGDLVLYCKSTGAEAPGLDPEEKTFSLFVYDIVTKKSARVPSANGVSLTAGFIKGDEVVWLDSHTGVPSMYGWKAGDAESETILELSGLESWQRPEVLGFDGQWVLYKVGDGNNYAVQYLDEVIGADYREPLGESLHAVNRVTGEEVTVIPRDSEDPLRIAHAGCVRGLAAFIAYRMHGEVVGGYWEDTCEESWLSLVRLASGISMPISFQPQVKNGQRFMMSESLIHYVDRVNAPPYSLSAAVYTSELTAKVFDLFSYETFTADLGTYAYKYELFGDRMITADPAARIVTFGKPISTATIAGQTPAPDTTGVPLDSDLTVVFSEDMKEESFTSEWIALSRLDGEGNFVERIALGISYDENSRILTLVPEMLQSDARYRVFMGGNVEDALGRALVQPRVWYFTTADVTGPSLVSSIPSRGSAVMAPGGAITLIFDEKVDQTSAAAAISLQQNGIEVAFTAYADDNGSLTLTPSSPLVYGTQYEVTGTSVLTDMKGNPLQNAFTLSFRTVGTFASALSGPIVYSDGMGTVSRIDADGSAQSVIASVSADNVLWSPDGSHIYCVSSGLQVMGADGSNLTTIADTLPWRFTPDFSPDGTRILYARQHEGTFEYDLVSAHLDGSDPQVLYSVSSGSITAVSWSPDGAHIAFVWFRDYASPVMLGILTVATGEVVLREDLTNPLWSPDGSRLYAQGKIEENGYRQSLIALFSDLQVDRVICELNEIAPAALSPTGQFIAFFMSDGIHVANLQSGTLDRRLVASAANMGPVRLFWSGDETKLVFNAVNVAGGWSTGAHVLDLAEGNIATIVTVAGGMPSLPMDWYAPSDTGTPVPVSVVLADLSTSEETRVRLSWEGYSTPAGFSEFRIYRAEAPFNYVTSMTPLAVTTGFTFDDTTAKKRNPYYYAVTAVTSGGRERTAVAPTGPLTPGDNDGLDDSWEERYFSGLGALPGDDPDADGLSNLREMQEFTDPTKADTDGDFAPDGMELERGMNPLVQDVLPLTLTAGDFEVEADATLTLVTTGGSGAYFWTLSDTGLAVVDSAGILSALAVGAVEITAHDSLFPGLASQPLTVSIVEERFALRQDGAVTLQRGGNVTIEAVGGSGIYVWEFSDDIPVFMEGDGSSRTFSSSAENGLFQVTVQDALRSELDPLTVTITIGEIPGDVNGDSRVTLDDAVAVLKVLTGMSDGISIFPVSDVNEDGTIGPQELSYILWKISMP